jgi:hypothetical protein
MFRRALANRRIFASSVHFGASLVVAAVVAGLVLEVWFPYPYFLMTGGVALLGILFGVDVVLGPLLTAVVASPAKLRRELIRDLCVIVVFQGAALAYGIYTIASARPVVVSFEIDRFRVLAAVDIDRTQLHDAPENLRRLSWHGPVLIAAVKPTDPGEAMKALDYGMAGFDLSYIPKYWRSYASQAAAVWKAARPLDLVAAKYPLLAADVSRIAQETHQPSPSLRFLPLMSRQASWIAVLASPDARIVGYLPADGFF